MPGLDDYTDAIAEPSTWMSASQKREFRAAHDIPADVEIDDWLQEEAESGDVRILDPTVGDDLDRRGGSITRGIAAGE